MSHSPLCRMITSILRRALSTGVQGTRLSTRLAVGISLIPPQRSRTLGLPSAPGVHTSAFCLPRAIARNSNQKPVRPFPVHIAHTSNSTCAPTLGDTSLLHVHIDLFSGKMNLSKVVKKKFVQSLWQGYNWNQFPDPRYRFLGSYHSTCNTRIHHHHPGAQL